MNNAKQTPWRDRLRPKQDAVAKAIGRSTRVERDPDATMMWLRLVTILSRECLTLGAVDFDTFAREPPKGIAVVREMDMVIGVRDIEFDPVGQCCFCGERCNPCSQACGHCARVRSI